MLQPRMAEEPWNEWGRGPENPAGLKAAGQAKDGRGGGGYCSTRGTRPLPGHPAPPNCLAITSGDNAEVDWGRMASESHPLAKAKGLEEFWADDPPFAFRQKPK